MLILMRKNQKSVFIKFAFAIIILSFVVGYAMLSTPGDRPGDGGSVAATVNGTNITVQNYQQAYRNLYTFYQNLYSDRFNAEMEKQLQLGKTAIDQLIRQALLEQEGDRIGIEVTRQEVIDSIAKVPTFQVNGAFDRNTYLTVLNYQRISPDDFEASQERVLFAEKVEEQIMSAVVVEESDIDAEYRKQNDKVNLEFVRLAPTLFESKVKVAAADLEKYFADNKEDFRVPTKVSLRYLQFEPGRYLNEIEPTEADLEKYYKRNLDKYEIEEQVSAAHVLIKVDQDADTATREEKRKLAEKVLEKARAGDDFAKLARTYSDDTGSAAKGGSLGYFNRGTMVPAFEQAAFNLKPGEISNIVESPFGLHVIKADGYIEPDVKKLEDVIEDVKSGVKEQISDQYAFEKAMDAYNINRKSGDLDKAAADNNLGIKETGLFDSETPIDGIGQSPEITAAAFTLDQSQLARPIRLDSGIYLISIKEKQESHIPEFAKVKKQVEAAYRKSKSVELAKTAADEMLAGLKDGKKLSTLTRKSGAQVEETGLFAASYGAFVPRLGNAEELAVQAFELNDDNKVAPQVYELGGRYVVATLKEKQEADMSQLDSEKREQLRETVTNNMRREVLDAKVEELKKSAEIEYSAYLVQLLERG